MASPVLNRVDHIFIHVSNLNASIQWYAELLGIEVTRKEYIGPNFTFHMEGGHPGLTLDNHCFDEEHQFIPSSKPLFNLQTDDIIAAYYHVKKLGADDVSEIQVYPDLSEFSFKDPDGNMIKVCTVMRSH